MKGHRPKRPAARISSRATATSASLVVDNGIDFSSDALSEAIQTLGVSLTACRPWDPSRKRAAERVFKSLRGRLVNAPATAQTASRSNGEEPK